LLQEMMMEVECE